MSTVTAMPDAELFSYCLSGIVLNFRRDIVSLASVATMREQARNAATWADEHLPGTGHAAAVAHAVDAFESVPLSVSSADGFCRVLECIARAAWPER